ncbi:MAG: hypothetical protein OXL96_13895 [Candidatus Poribacteria bacterium]|nr:hypothetical protein [Candidatus Poribacteria bacterium]
MDLSFETIDACRAITGKITTDVFSKIPPKPTEHWKHKGKHRTTPHDNNFQDAPLNGQLPGYDFVDGHLRTFHGSQWGIVVLKDVRVREIESVEFSEPELLNRTVESINVKTWSNAGNTKETHKITTKKASSKTIIETSATEIGVQITQSLRTKLGGGIKGIGEGEVTTGLDIQTHFKKNFGTEVTTSSSEEETEEKTYIVEPWTRVVLKREEGTSDYRQIIKTTGIIDATVWIESHGDFGFEVDSFLTLERIIRGGYADNVDPYILQYFAERHFQAYQIDFSPLRQTVEVPIHLRNVRSSQIERIDTPIRHRRRKNRKTKES